MHPLNLDSAIVYDIETLTNCFTLDAESLHGEWRSTWEISDFRDDRASLFEWFAHLRDTQTPMIGFNSVHFDYPVIHYLYTNPSATAAQIYAKAQEIIHGDNYNRFAHVIWDRDRFAPQVDLFKVFHFDNRAKSTSLKYLQINMRLPSVVESMLPWDAPVTQEQIERELIPYNIHDVQATKSFALCNLDALQFRNSLVPEHGIDVLNWNDTKIGENILIDKVGRDRCFDWSSGRKQKRQTVRTSVVLNDIVFPYVRFDHPEFQRVLDYMRTQVLTPDEIWEAGTMTMGDKIKTKGVFSGLSAHVGGLEYDFGTGGIHASVKSEHIAASDGYVIRDIDVASLYPSIAIENSLAPEHLGSAFVAAYGDMRSERKRWQAEKGKKCVEANAIKLGLNGAYGKSNDAFSVLFDSQITMTITLNGQLSIAMLVEWLLAVPTLRVLSANTDGISYFVHESHMPLCVEIEQRWQDLTRLVLEAESYEHVYQRDVNSYVWVKADGTYKAKGAYWTPDPLDWHGSVANAQPAAWHKDLGAPVIPRAAVAAMVHGIDPETYVRVCVDPFDFMLQVKIRRADRLMLGERELQRTTRYFVARNGERMMKVSPPPTGYEVGQFKRASKLSDAEYHRVMAEIGPGVWDARIHTKNKSRYANRETSIQTGHLVRECNDAANFDWGDVNYDWYVAEARRLVIS